MNIILVVDIAIVISIAIIICLINNNNINIDGTAFTNNSNSNLLFYYYYYSPIYLWKTHFKEIVQYSQNQKFDPRFVLKERTEFLLSKISNRLPRSVKNLPRDWTVTQRIIQKGTIHYNYLQQQQLEQGKKQTKKDDDDDISTIPPPIKIVVMGGSVTMGINCKTIHHPICGGRCAWPFHLQNLINNWAGGELVTVSNDAIGGTNSKIADSMIRYELVPVESQTPDILINSYSTNDMHITTMKEASNTGIDREEYIMQIQQQFVRTALSSYPYPCQQPFLLFVNDYLGNEQREIMATTEAGISMQRLADYYGFGAVSYADMVRDLVYEDTREPNFSPNYWYQNVTAPIYHCTNPMKREIHHSDGPHTTISYMITYYFMVLTNNYYSIYHHDHDTNTSSNSKTTDNDNNSNSGGIYFLPPPLTKTLSLETISEGWNKNGTCFTDNDNDSSSSNNNNVVNEERNDEDSLFCDVLSSSSQQQRHQRRRQRCSISWMNNLKPNTYHSERYGWGKQSKSYEDKIKNDIKEYFVPFIPPSLNNTNISTTNQNQQTMLFAWDGVDAGGRNPKPGTYVRTYVRICTSKTLLYVYVCHLY